MEDGGDDFGSYEDMSTTPSPAASDTASQMSIESSPQHLPSKSPVPGDGSSHQLPPLGVRRSSTSSVAMNLLRSMAKAAAGLRSASSDDALAARSSSQQGAPSASTDASGSSSISQSPSDLLRPKVPDNNDPPRKSVFNIISSSLSSGRISITGPVSDDEDDEVAQIFERDFDNASRATRSFDHVPRKDYSSAQVLDSSSPELPQGLRIIHSPGPDLSVGYNSEARRSQSHGPVSPRFPTASRVDSVGGLPAGASSGSSGLDAFGLIAASHACVCGAGTAIGKHDCSAGRAGLPALNALEPSPEAGTDHGKDTFGSGFARSSQRGPKHRSNPYNRPPNPPKTKTLSPDDKSDDEL